MFDIDSSVMDWLEWLKSDCSASLGRTDSGQIDCSGRFDRGLTAGASDHETFAGSFRLQGLGRGTFA